MTLVPIELGAGLAIPTVRRECESAAGIPIRVNPRDAAPAGGGIALPLRALEALRRLDRLIEEAIV